MGAIYFHFLADPEPNEKENERERDIHLSLVPRPLLRHPKVCTEASPVLLAKPPLLSMPLLRLAINKEAIARAPIANEEFVPPIFEEELLVP